MTTEECDDYIRQQLPLLFQYLEDHPEKHGFLAAPAQDQGSGSEDSDDGVESDSDDDGNDMSSKVLKISHDLLWVLCGKVKQKVFAFHRPPTGDLMDRVKGRPTAPWKQCHIYISMSIIYSLGVHLN